MALSEAPGSLPVPPARGAAALRSHSPLEPFGAEAAVVMADPEVGDADEGEWVAAEDDPAHFSPLQWTYDGSISQCVLVARRPGGVLLAVPAGVITDHDRAAGFDDPAALIGPTEILEAVPLLSRTDGRVLASATAPVELVDFRVQEAAAAGVSSIEAFSEEAAGITAFDRLFRWPSGAALLTAATQFATEIDAGYSSAAPERNPATEAPPYLSAEEETEIHQAMEGELAAAQRRAEAAERQVAAVRQEAARARGGGRGVAGARLQAPRQRPRPSAGRGLLDGFAAPAAAPGRGDLLDDSLGALLGHAMPPRPGAEVRLGVRAQRALLSPMGSLPQPDDAAGDDDAVELTAPSLAALLAGSNAALTALTAVLQGQQTAAAAPPTQERKKKASPVEKVLGVLPTGAAAAAAPASSPLLAGYTLADGEGASSARTELEILQSALWSYPGVIHRRVATRMAFLAPESGAAKPTRLEDLAAFPDPLLYLERTGGWAGWPVGAQLAWQAAEALAEGWRTLSHPSLQDPVVRAALSGLERNCDMMALLLVQLDQRRLDGTWNMARLCSLREPVPASVFTSSRAPALAGTTSQLLPSEWVQILRSSMQEAVAAQHAHAALFGAGGALRPRPGAQPPVLPAAAPPLSGLDGVLPDPAVDAPVPGPVPGGALRAGAAAKQRAATARRAAAAQAARGADL